MKRILSLALVTIMLLMTLALTSCDLESIDVNAIIEQVMVSLGLAEKEPVYTITQEEWDANMALTNFTMEIVTVGSDGFENTSNILASENAIKISTSANGQDTVIYMVLEGDIAYMIMDYQGQQIVQKVDFSDMNLEEIVGNAFTFDQFEYNEEERCYVHYMEAAAEMGVTYKMYFENGWFKSVVLEQKVEGYSQTMTYTFSNIGTTVVEVPDFTRP